METESLTKLLHLTPTTAVAVPSQEGNLHKRGPILQAREPQSMRARGTERLLGVSLKQPGLRAFLPRSLNLQSWVLGSRMLQKTELCPRPYLLHLG